MKTRSLILLCCIVFFSSCIVKSIQPFYTADSTEFQEHLVGEWIDNKKGNWTVVSFKQMFLEENKDLSKVSEEDKAAYEKYKDGYLITYTKKNNESVFMGMPFKVYEQVFIDFIPFDYEDISNDLVSQHLLRTHSVAKIDKTADDQLNITWLDEGRLTDLFEKNQLKLKYETVGIDESFVLTATSEELYAFLKKYMKANIENKWDSSEKFTLTKTNAQP
jgi:hypothetical protein